MKPNIKHQRCGIYCIRNLINNKVYIGKSKNIYKRIHQHLYDLKNQRDNENIYLLRSWIKYGEFNFEYFVLEYLEKDDELVAKRELYWMSIYDSLNNGYNLRSDSDSRMIVNEKTSEKISNRLKKEWSEGIRSEHGKKLSENWKTTPERNKQQSELFSKLKTKYLYKINNELLDYTQLKELGFQNVQATFHKKKSNIVTYKNTIIERVKIEDIVRHSEKSEITEMK